MARAVRDTRKSGRSSQANYSSRSRGEDSETSGSDSRQGWEVQEAPSSSGDDGFRLETSLGNLVWSCKDTSGSCLVI